jgi:hypothetical protein
MNDFNNLTDNELRTILTFTKAIAGGIQRQSLDVNLSDDASLAEAEKQAVAFAERRKAGFTNSRFDEGEEDGDGNVRKRVRDWLRRSGRVSNG